VLKAKVSIAVRLASILNNLGNLYSAQGDSATAEKMQRQALPFFTCAAGTLDAPAGYRPHPRHREAMAELVGVSADGR
jgi:hypothetical protein